MFYLLSRYIDIKDKMPMFVPALILSVVWLVILVMQLLSPGWLMSLQYIMYILLVMVIIDIVAFR